ncbi:hypothetical protein [Pectobacterium polaris]|uniref:hypothetical protein n=1 Tax=Pectobacterium polaris TaxID=2042057 RepID=UPI001581465E|nr:hypothetical protein [Pectobacterium polaris]
MINKMNYDVFDLYNHMKKNYVFFKEVYRNGISTSDFNSNLSVCIQGNMINFKSFTFKRHGGILKITDSGINYPPVCNWQKKFCFSGTPPIEIINEHHFFDEEILGTLDNYQQYHKKYLSDTFGDLPSKIQKNHQIDSLASFIKKINELSHESDKYIYFFRGHSDE